MSAKNLTGSRAALGKPGSTTKPRPKLVLTASNLAAHPPSSSKPLFQVVKKYNCFAVMFFNASPSGNKPVLKTFKPSGLSTSSLITSSPTIDKMPELT